MDLNLIDSIQDQIEIKSYTGMITHEKNYTEVGCKRFYDLWYIKSGELSYVYDEQIYTLLTGDLFLIYPDIPYEATIISDTLELVYTRFEFITGSTNTLLSNFPLSGHIPRNSYAQTELEDVLTLFSKHVDMLHSKKTFIRYQVKQYFNLLLMQIIYTQMADSSNSISPSSKKYSAKLNRLSPALEHIIANRHLTIPTSDLADLVGMSHKYFITYFKQILGITPHQYQIERKMIKAADLLTTNAHSIKEIADLLGYKDQYNFSSAFKKHYGIAPSQFSRH